MCCEVGGRAVVAPAFEFGKRVSGRERPLRPPYHRSGSVPLDQKARRPAAAFLPNSRSVGVRQPAFSCHSRGRLRYILAAVLAIRPANGYIPRTMPISEKKARRGVDPSDGLPATMEWVGGAEGYLKLLDQTQLPARVAYLECRTAEDVWEAIARLSVRGAPAIGVAAAYGLCVGVQPFREKPARVFRAELARVGEYLCGSRPTAVNLAWAVRRATREVDDSVAQTAAELWDVLFEMARAIHEEDARVCRAIGEHGAALIAEGMGVLTHCNAGALATAGCGTALSLMYEAHRQGRAFHVFADETRPLLQGARLTAFELSAAGVDVSVLCDNMAASLMREGRIDLVIVGADRIAANGDTANKIGTYGVAVLARHHGIPFYVAAPRSTFDLALRDGSAIPIEQRDPQEVRGPAERPNVPASVTCVNPAFDVTPADLIAGIVTEAGIVTPVTAEKIRKIFAAGA